MAAKPKAKTQREKFEEAARELGTDQSEEAFDRALKKVAKAPPPKDDKSGSRPK
ncbi:DNA-binding protein [Nitratireductor sp. ZSWI3]|uniref:DNA-binding protein n=1 Tax=Nitratireductor sp. ZSWI3 TaxID=2966359 RepID=UPI00214FAC30|nr:DNA-binding protein [Nitratireductor sp. ZSWI3]MCR4268752.1 DNA-binding protein [Nitratireductor sp. ZSWI3]